MKLAGQKNLGTSSIDLYHVKLAFIVSILAWPITYLFNNGFEKIDQTDRTLWMMLGGFLILVSVTAGVAKISKVHDWLYYGVFLFSFTCMIDTIIALEYHGYIDGFMSEYLKLGEPYLSSPWGSAISLFDGIGFYPMYFAIIFQISNGKSWRSTGIWWAAGLINSMVVLLFGVFTGKHSPTFCTFLNVPYALFPIFAVIRAFGKEKRRDWKETRSSGFFTKIFDLFLITAFLASIWIKLVKGLGSLGSQFQVIENILKHEPSIYLEDPAPFARIQSMIYLLYLVPIEVVSLIYMFRSRKPHYLWEMGLIHAGIVLQGQFSFICMALDPHLSNQFQSSYSDATFWIVNLLILIVPNLYLLRLLPHRNSIKIIKKRQ